MKVADLRRGESGEFEHFGRLCNPFPGRDEPAASARMVREFGVASEQLESAASGECAWSELAAFVGARALVVQDGEAFGAWAAHFEGRARPTRCVLGLTEFRAQ